MAVSKRVRRRTEALVRVVKAHLTGGDTEVAFDALVEAHRKLRNGEPVKVKRRAAKLWRTPR